MASKKNADKELTKIIKSFPKAICVDESSLGDGVFFTFDESYTKEEWLRDHTEGDPEQSAYYAEYTLTAIKKVSNKVVEETIE